MAALQKITDAQMNAAGVCAAPDILNGTAEENKAVFDRMVRQVVAIAYNNLVDQLEAMGVEMIVRYGNDAVTHIRLNADKVLEVSADGINWEATGSSGHLIVDAKGNTVPQRSRMQFVNGTVEDKNGVTVITGVKGDRGEKGDTGPQGVQGATGPQGKPGPVIVPSVDVNGVMSFSIQDTAAAPQSVSVRGPQGPQGVQGQQGAQGARGPQGIQGVAGIQGPPGEQGKQGVAGPQGPQGVAGTQGPAGPCGPAGTPGKDGTSLYIEDTYSTLASLRNALPNGNDKMYMTEDTGECHIWSERAKDWVSVGKLQGPIGPEGPAGPQGAQGPAGPQGEQGVPGQTGAQGVPGAQGPVGPEGPQGPAGVAGKDGKSAYQTAAEAGYAGTETAFNAALAAAPGHISNKNNPHAVTAEQVGAAKQNQHKFIHYTALSDIGLSVGSETMQSIFSAMPNCCELTFEVGAANADIYPVHYGLVTIVKYNTSRCFGTFITKDSNIIYSCQMKNESNTFTFLNWEQTSAIIIADQTNYTALSTPLKTGAIHLRYE